MPSTLRYGSGLLDVPVSSVLPHLHVTGTLSGFWVSLDRRVEVGPFGEETGFSGPVSELYTDGSLAVGLFDRVETGISLQALGDESSGGNIWGLFGRVRVWEPVDQGLGLAAGARWLSRPSFGDGVRYVPGRLGFPDQRLARSYTGGTTLTAYGVATAYLRGFDGGRIPENDMTFSLGYGSGMFHAGGKLDLYSEGHSSGWFFGTSIHVATSAQSVLIVMAEHNGFDVNVGAQFDWSGLRVGAHWLASNHAPRAGGYASEYAKPKLGLLASVAVCPSERGLRCRPRMMRRVEPDTIFIPPPPPDTVVVRVEDVTPSGEDTEICLATGQNVPIRITQAGDTLVGPDYVSLRSARPLLDFAGTYASGTFWHENGEPITFEGNLFGRAPDTFPIACDQVLRVGVHEGVPLFADVAAERPLSMLFVPVRPGVWRRYERGLP
ncbi:MAG TPA: hypothetical protein VMM35_04820 [Longimicrobiales bacterium]|nr:hypothetical protein [Longimicrobiales bacterium]